MTLFDRYADCYEKTLDQSLALGGFGGTSGYFYRYKADYLAHRFSPRASGSLLDFGCGTGLMAQHVKRAIPRIRYHGYDPSGASIRAARRHFGKYGLFFDNAHQLDCGYDMVLLANVLHHIRPETHLRTLQELSHRLNSGGAAVVFEHNPLNPVSRWIFTHSPIDREAAMVPPRQARRLLSMAGFEITRLEYLAFVPPLLEKFAILDRIFAPLPIGAQYAVIARKTL